MKPIIRGRMPTKTLALYRRMAEAWQTLGTAGRYEEAQAMRARFMAWLKDQWRR